MIQIRCEQGANLVVFPECALTGYYFAGYQEDQVRGPAAPQVPEPILILPPPFFEGTPEHVGPGALNCAEVVSRVFHIYPGAF